MTSVVKTVVKTGHSQGEQANCLVYKTNMYVCFYEGVCVCLCLGCVCVYVWLGCVCICVCVCVCACILKAVPPGIGAFIADGNVACCQVMPRGVQKFYKTACNFEASSVENQPGL